METGGQEEATKTATPFKTVSDNRADDYFFPGDQGLKISQTINIEKTLHEQTRTK